MRSEIYWIPTHMSGRLAVMPRPRGGDWLEDEVHSWRSQGVDIVVSLLTPDEVIELNLSSQQSLCEGQGIQFISHPIADRGVPPSKEAVRSLARDLAGRLSDGKNVAIHCRQGIGRAPLIAICVLVMAGVELASALSMVGAARGCLVPETLEQRQWLAEFVKEPLALAST